MSFIVVAFFLGTACFASQEEFHTMPQYGTNGAEHLKILMHPNATGMHDHTTLRESLAFEVEIVRQFQNDFATCWTANETETYDFIR